MVENVPTAVVGQVVMVLAHAPNCTDSDAAPLFDRVSVKVTCVLLLINTVCDALTAAVTFVPVAEGTTVTEPLKPLLGITVTTMLLLPAVRPLSAPMLSEKGSFKL